ncbi:hypothetical protein [Mycobacterium tuberculosis]|uniref:hypothetical protein n=2 Tax=Mycobacterium tuberculosis TaxID=1773 RepID=UPI001F38AE3C|nr:hypothetical protein [Mycobacterium tuberculosis]
MLIVISVSPDMQNTSATCSPWCETPDSSETAVCRASSEAMGLVDRGIVAGLQDRAGLLDLPAPVDLRRLPPSGQLR